MNNSSLDRFREERKRRREFLNMSAEEYTTIYNNMVMTPLEEGQRLSADNPLWLSTDFGALFSGYTCYEIADILRKNGVTTKGIKEDHEHSCCYFYFSTHAMAKSFCKRLGDFLVKRRTIATQWGLSLSADDN